MSPKISFLRPALCFCALSIAAHAETTFTSGPTQVTLIELYTSEGCSSCPPAEKWLGELRAEKGLWREFVPVAFHVNYWDHLGWRDALASRAFTARERAYAADWNAESVYTPCLVRNGAEWRVRPAAPISERAAISAGTLTMTWQPETRTCRVDYVPTTERPGDFDVSVALLGNGIVNKVRKGENAGRELRHEFVALRLETTQLKKSVGGSWSATVQLATRDDIAAPQHALAGWVTPRGKLSPIQATGGWLEGKGL